MKKTIITFLVVMSSSWSFPLFSQVENEVIALGLPGDNLNLYAVLDIFQNSITIEEFERKLNVRDSNVNNLDLNNDNFVDYISVTSYNQGHFHSIVLSVSVNTNQLQDVAVIEVSKNSAGSVIVQVVGDEALYGRDYVVEPSMRAVSATPNPAYIGDQTIIINNRVYGNGIVYVSEWPIIGLLFSPSFSIYASPWHWGYYPVYWNPWRPILYYNYWNYHNHYYRSYRYHRTSHIRFPSHHSSYLRRRTTSAIVTRNRREGVYRSTYGGKDFRRPAAPPRVSRRDINRANGESKRGQRSSTRRQNRESTRERVQPSTRRQERQSTRQRSQPSTRRQERQSTRQRSQPSTSPQRQPTRQKNRQPTRRRVPPSEVLENRPLIVQENVGRNQQRVKAVTSLQDLPSTKQANRQLTSPQARPSKKQIVPLSARRTNRQLKRSARHSARETRQSSRVDRNKDLP
jgi:flagellar biosynthesis GTPase FlhF